MKVFVSAILLAVSFIFQSHACDMHGLSGFMPENDMSVPVDAKIRNDMTEQRFNQIIDKVEAHYRPIIKKKWAVLKINRLWKNDTVNASAQQFLRLWVVNMYGGLARHPAVTDDAFALVICHELGHHLGGAPRNSIPMSWASNEGQADYFGNLKCFRRVFREEDNMDVIAGMNVDEEVRLRCEAQWANAEDAALCMRAAMAGKSLADLLGGGRSISFKTPDTSVVDRTNNRHPAAQCRLDTYFQATLCDKRVEDRVDRRNPDKGVCSRSAGYEEGIRPLCWFKPKS